MPKIKIPASTANMGAGFDSLGMALSLYNEVEFDIRESGYFQIEVIETNDSTNEESIEVPLNEENLIYQSIQTTLNITGIQMPGLHIRQINRIPQTRGLGSSSACIVGGIIAGNIISGGILSTDAMIDIACSIEGHPDNVLPTFIGGMTAGAMVENSVKFVSIDPPRDLKCCMLIPDFPLSTSQARAVLPDNVSMEDAIFNLSRSALMVGAMAQGRFDLISVALEDRLHESYRKTLIHGFDEVTRAAKKAGALGCCLSGAGPTMLAFLSCDYRQFVQQIKHSLKKLGLPWRVELLDICREGATWETD